MSADCGIICILQALTFSTHNHLVPKRTLKHLIGYASLVNWLSVRLRTYLFWIRVPLQSIKLQISRLFRSKKYFDIQAATKCRFTPKRVGDMIRIESQLTFRHNMKYITCNIKAK